MDMLATLNRSGGINALARQLGEAPAATQSGVVALLPTLLNSFRNYGNSIDDLFAILNEFGDGGMAADVMGTDHVTPAPGEAILIRIFGNPEAVRAIHREAAMESGVDTALLERTLPLLAMLVGGYISARTVGKRLSAEELEEIFDPGVNNTPPDDELI